MPSSQRAATLSIEAQHSAILACCDELMDALRAGQEASAIATIRVKLAGLLHANLMSEEAELNATIRGLLPQDRPSLFSELADEAALLRGKYSEHVGRWTTLAISMDQSAYSRAAGQLVTAVKAHLSRKGAVLAEWRKVAASVAGPRAAG